MKKSATLVILISGLFLIGCASGYKEIVPDSQKYLSSVESKGVLLEYKYDVLKKKKYLKKESKKGVKLVSVKISNKSTRDLIFGKDIKLVNSNGLDLMLITNNDAYDYLKQKSGFYFFYLLLTPLQLFTTNSNGETSSVPIGLAIGPGLTLGNFIVANSANNKFKNEMTYFDLYNKTIKSGETIYGLISIKSESHEQINLVITD